MIFYWLTPFSDSFVVCDWFELVIYFHTNERDDKQNVFTVNFQTTAIYDKVLGQIYANFGKETFQEEQQKAIDMFFKGNDVSVSLPIGYGKSLLYQAAPVIDRLSSLEESGHYISCADPLKLSQETTCTIS